METLGAIAKSGSTYYALSCDHVMKSEDSRRIVHPGHYDHLKYPQVASFNFKVEHLVTVAMATKSKRFKMCLCIQQGIRRFAADGDSGSVIFEITKENNHILLKGLELLFGLLEHQYHHFILASPLQVVLEAFTTEHPNGSGLELVSKYIE